VPDEARDLQRLRGHRRLPDKGRVIVEGSNIVILRQDHVRDQQREDLAGSPSRSSTPVAATLKGTPSSRGRGRRSRRRTQLGSATTSG
jgi:hypothetical protein